MNASTETSSPPDRIRVLYIIWSLQMGGAERVVADLARGLDRTVFEPMVCCLNFKGHLAADLEREGIPVFALDKKPKLDASLLPKLVRLMRRERVDVVHSHLWTSSFWGRMAAAVARVPVVVVTEHNLDTWRRAPHFLADRLLGALTNHFIFVSEDVHAFYDQRLSLKPGAFHVVHNGVDLSPFERVIATDAAKKSLGVPLDRPVVGVVGRLDPRKGHRHFVEAIATLAHDQPPPAGLIVGDGATRQALEAQVRDLELSDRLRITGYWPDLAEAFAAVDIFVLPSLMEGHPLAILEAMAAGKPVVATAVGGNARAVEHGVTGLLVPPAEPAALADAIRTLVRDPEAARRMGRAGRERVEQRFSLAAAVKANEAVYLKYCPRAQDRGIRVA